MLAELKREASPAAPGWREDVDDGEWEALLARDPRSTVMQHPEMLRIVASHHPGWRARWLESRDASGTLRAGLPVLRRRRFGMLAFASGFAGLYGGPVADDEDHETRLGPAFLREGGWRTLRRELVWGRTAPPRGEWGRLLALPTAHLDVDPSLEFDRFLLDVFPKNRRNEANRSDRRGLRVEIDVSGDRLPSFYPIYHRQCERWGTPAVPEPVLRDALRRFEEVALFVAIDRDDRLMGGHVVIGSVDELFAWVGTTERSREVFPSTVLIREEARWCHRNGVRGLNLGTSLGLSGVENYKKLLGARDSSRWILRQRRWPQPRGGAA